MRIRERLIVLFLIMAVIPLLIVTLISVNYNRTILEETISRQISSTAHDRAEYAETFMKDRIAFSELIASRTVLKERFYTYSLDHNAQELDVLESMLNDSKGSVEGITDISLVDLNGITLASTNPKLLGTNYSKQDCFVNGLKNSGVCFDTAKDEDGAPGIAMITSSPMKIDENIIGVVLLFNNVSHLEEIIKEKSIFGNSSEVLMAIKDGDSQIFLFERKFESQALPEIQQSADVALLIKLALNKTDGLVLKAKDYRGVDVIASIEYIPTGEVGLVAKIDVKEAFKSIDNMEKITLFTVFITIIFVVLLAAYLSENITKPITELNETMTDISKGRIDVVIEPEIMRSSDEMGDLARSTARVLVSLKLAILRMGITKEQMGLGEALAAKKEAEEKYKTLFDSINYAVFIHDLKGEHFIEVNETACKSLGYSRGELLMLRPQDIDLPAFAKLKEQILVELKEKGTTTFETTYRTKEGKEISIEITSRMIKYNNEPVVMSIAKDISRRKEIEKLAKEKSERFEKLFESSRDAIMTLEPPKWNFTSCNPATIKLFGATDEKHFLSTVPWQLSPKKQPDGQDSPSKAKKMIELAMKNGSNFFEWTHKRFNGEEFLATVLLSRMNINEKNMLQATVRDISEMKNISWELKKSKDEMANIIELNPYSIQICDAEGHHIHANKAFEQLFGAIPPEGYSVFEDPVVKKSGIDKYISQLKKGKPIKIPAFWYDPHDADPAAPSKKVCISITAFPIFDSTGKITNVVLMHESVMKG